MASPEDSRHNEEEVSLAKPAKTHAILSADEEGILIKDLESLAIKMVRWIQKFPKSNKKFLRKPSDRYMALIPMPKMADDGLSKMQRWQRGLFAYWESKDAYAAHSEPKGYLSLVRIVKVRHIEREHDGRGVLLKYMKEGIAQEMTLLFADKNEAREFSYMLWEFLAKLHGEWSQQSPSSCTGVRVGGA